MEEGSDVKMFGFFCVKIVPVAFETEKIFQNLNLGVLTKTTQGRIKRDNFYGVVSSRQGNLGFN